MVSVGVRINEENIARLNAVIEKLGGGELATVQMRTAVSKAARQAAKILGKAAGERYVTDVSEKDIKVKRRGAGATLSVSGPMTDLQTHRVSSFAVSNGRTPDAYAAQILRESGMKRLMKYGHKAFVARFKNGHMAFVVRAPGKKKEGEVLESLFALNKPEMIGNEHVYGEHEEEIAEALNKEIMERLDRFL